MASSVSSKKQKSALIWNAVERFSTQAIHLRGETRLFLPDLPPCPAQ